MALANSKSTLAKLLAQENITVEHRNTSTAYFDPKNRVLVLPVWKNMSNDLYDLLVGHEVGHAWETPAEGWHSEIKGNKPGFKSYLNVVEDARIEKCIKNRYPGLRTCFYKAYKELVDRNFFGVADMNLNDLQLIDRINLHFKVGPFMAVPFKPEEQIYINKIENMTTWEDVVRISKELYNLRKEEMNEERKQLSEIRDYEDYDGEDDGSDFDDDSFESEIGDEFEDDASNESSNSLGAGEGEFDPQSLTDKEFRKRENDLISDETRPYRYVNLPVFDCDKFIVSHKELYSTTDWSCFDSQDPDLSYRGVINNGAALFAEYKQTYSKFIQYLVKEFELKRNASQFARAKVSKTGELDIDKVFSYKYNNDIFKRVTKIPNGKNHGMVMFVDWSGSMYDSMQQTLEQTLVLADFCKKVNIPFKVFSFSDAPSPIRKQDSYTEAGYRINTKYTRRTGDIYFDSYNARMYELLSSDMNFAQYTNAQKRILQVGSVFSRANYRSDVPHGWELGGTPLNEAIVFANYYLPKFKEANRLDIVNAIILTDGESNDSDNVVIDDADHYRSINSHNGLAYREYANTVINDKATGKSGRAKPGQPLTAALLDLLKKNTDVNLIGYYILNSSSKSRINHFIHAAGLSDTEYSDTIINKLRKDKFYSIDSYVYDKYFLVKSDDLEIKNTEMNVTSDSSKRDLMKAFMQSQKSKIVNRVLLNKFIAEIA
jgi:hypothetical protein